MAALAPAVGAEVYLLPYSTQKGRGIANLLEEHLGGVLVESVMPVAQQRGGNGSAADVDALHRRVEREQLAVCEQRGLT